MKTDYTSLKQYLNNSVNESIINEGLLDKLFGGFGKNKEQQKQGTILGGIFGSISSLFKGITDKTDTEDPFVKAYKDMAKKERENEKKRLEDELKAETDLEISKMWAAFDTEQHNLDLKTAQKVRIYGAKKKQVDSYRGSIAKDNLIHSQEEIEQMVNTISEIDRDLTQYETSPLKEMADIATQIFVKEDGTVRTQEEIMNDESLKESIDQYNKIAGKYKKPLIDAMSSEEYEEQTKKYRANINDSTEIEQSEKAIEEMEKQFKDRIKLYEKYKGYKDKYDDANNAVENAKDAFNNYKDNNPFLKGEDEGASLYDDETGKVTPMDKSKLSNTIKSIFNTAGYMTSDDGSSKIDANKIGEKMSEFGFSQDAIGKFKEKLNSNDIIDNDNKFDEALRSIDDMLETEANNIADKAKQKLAGLKENITSTENALKDTPNPDTEEGWNKIKENALETEKEDLEKIENLKNGEQTKDEWSNGMYDSTNNGNGSQYTGMLKTIENEKTKIKDKKQTIEDAREANKKMRLDALNRMTSRKDNAVPDEIKKAVEKATDGIEAGEKFNDQGKLGFETTDENGNKKWIEKPGPSADEDKKNEYKKLRNLHILTMSAEEQHPYKDIGQITKNDDGTYTIKHKNGEVYLDKASEQDAIHILATKRSEAKSRGEILAKKQELADSFKKCIKDNKFDPTVFDNFNDETKAALTKIFKDVENAEDEDVKETLSKYFEGMDIGTNTPSDLKKLIGNKDTRKQINNAIDNIDDEVYKKVVTYNNGINNYDDENDEDEDANDETDYDIEDEENAKNSNGDDLIKGDDGKWYKKNSDGSPDTESGPQENTAKKKLSNPAKKWHKKKNKKTGRSTKNFYDSEGNSITPEEYHDKMQRYKEAKARHNSNQTTETNTHLKYYLANILESKNISYNPYIKLKTHLLTNIE